MCGAFQAFSTQALQRRYRCTNSDGEYRGPAQSGNREEIIFASGFEALTNRNQQPSCRRHPRGRFPGRQRQVGDDERPHELTPAPQMPKQQMGSGRGTSGRRLAAWLAAQRFGTLAVGWYPWETVRRRATAARTTVREFCPAVLDLSGEVIVSQFLQACCPHGEGSVQHLLWQRRRGRHGAQKATMVRHACIALPPPTVTRIVR